MIRRMCICINAVYDSVQYSVLRAGNILVVMNNCLALGDDSVSSGDSYQVRSDQVGQASSAHVKIVRAAHIL
jgi:hypothetical protein